MKNIFYLIVAYFMFVSLQSCKRVQGEDGDLLSNAISTDEGITGERFLYREYDQGELVKEYHYNKRKLMKVIQPKDSSVTTFDYTANRINSLTYSQVYNGDSTAYTRLYFYDEEAKVNEIRELKVFKPKDQENITKRDKSNYFVEYEGDKLKSIIMKTGQQIPGQEFNFTAYTKANYTFEGDNIVHQTKVYGMMSGNDFGNTTSRRVYQYGNYDAKIAPFTLILHDYRLSQLIDAEAEAYRFSANNVREITYSSTESPNPVVITSLFTYDPQDYGLLGFGRMYDYRPL